MLDLVENEDDPKLYQIPLSIRTLEWLFFQLLR